MVRDGLKRVRGQHARGPAKRKRPSRFLRTLAVFSVLAAIVALWIGVRTLVHLPMLRVHHLGVAGAQRVAQEQVLARAEPTRGQPLLLLDLDALRAELETIPGVQRASVLRRPPDLLLLEIVERRAIARTRLGKRTRLVDEDGVLFPTGRGLDGDGSLPSLRGLATGEGASELAQADQVALRALAALARATRRQPPPGTMIDLSHRDRIEMQLGGDAPTLVLDRKHPETNLENLFAMQERVIQFASGRAIDLRFPGRLTLVPAKNQEARR